jgi:hypothetical protein
MDLASIEAYALPSFATVSAKVARETEGAAPNNPAKLRGFSNSPKRAKVETTAPPISTLKKISFTFTCRAPLSSNHYLSSKKCGESAMRVPA